MAAWTSDELVRIEGADELRIASLRRSGALGSPRTIWVVRIDDDLYIRSVRGRTSDWFGNTQVCHGGRIGAGGVERDVSFEDAAPDLADEIDAAYRTKYHRYAATIVNSVLTSEARSATLKLVPR